jgi:hypothetical protein
MATGLSLPIRSKSCSKPVQASGVRPTSCSPRPSADAGALIIKPSAIPRRAMALSRPVQPGSLSNSHHALALESEKAAMTFDLSSLPTAAEVEALIGASPAPKVTKADMEAKIYNVAFYWHRHLTICIIELDNGFMTVGHSAPASRENFNERVGQYWAFQDAFKKLWPLEGYRLRCELYEKERPVEV